MTPVREDAPALDELGFECFTACRRSVRRCSPRGKNLIKFISRAEGREAFCLGEATVLAGAGSQS